MVRHERWRLPGDIPFCGMMRGPGQAAYFFDALGLTQENHRLHMSEFVASGNKVVAIGRYAATVKATQKHFNMWLIHCWEIEDGMVKSYRNFSNTAAIAEAYV